MHPKRRSPIRFAAAAALLIAPGAASAQSSIAVAAGASNYDLSGVGWAPVGSVRYERAVSTSLFWEIGSTFFRYETQADRYDNLLLPETGLRLAFPLGESADGYVAGGVGANVTIRGSRDADLTLFGAAGLEFALSGPWAMRTEARIRSLDPWTGTMFDLTLGLSRALGG